MGDMGSELCPDQSNENQVLPLKMKSLENSVFGPATPDTDKENGDFPLDLTSPLAVPKKLPQVLIFTSQTNKNGDFPPFVNDSTSPRTPKDGVFDPFAPGPDDKLWAPQRKKYFDEARTSVARRLTFTSSFKGFDYSNDEHSLSDEKILESVYENLLEVIVSNQTESVLAELSNAAARDDFCLSETPPPTSAPWLNGVAETCPGAPLKPTGKSRSIDLGLCRKLEF